MDGLKWIKIVTDIFDDEKILLIEQLPDADSIIVIWFKLLCLAGKQNNSGVIMIGRLPCTDEMLASIFRRPLNTVKLALNTFENLGMIEIVNNCITIPKWSVHQDLDKLEKQRDYMREYMQKYRKKQKMLTDGKSKDVNVYDVNEVNVGKTNVNAQTRPYQTIPDQTIPDDTIPDQNPKKGAAEKATSFDTIISEAFDNDEIRSALREFIKMRKLIKKPMTDHALELTIKKLNELAKNDNERIAILEQSIANSWQGLFPLEKGKAKGAGYGEHSVYLDENDERVGRAAEDYI